MAKKYRNGDKGMNTAQRKERFMKDLERKQAAEQKEISGKNFTRIMSGNYHKKDLDERLRIADAATKRLARNREATVYKPQREKDSAQFDKNTKYDDLLGRSTNPAKKYRKGGKSKVNEAGNYTKPGMRKRIFSRIKAGTKGGNAGQWSARKAQMLAKAYKAAGGGYKN